MKTCWKIMAYWWLKRIFCGWPEFKLCLKELNKTKLDQVNFSLNKFLFNFQKFYYTISILTCQLLKMYTNAALLTKKKKSTQKNLILCFVSRFISWNRKEQVSSCTFMLSVAGTSFNTINSMSYSVECFHAC